MRMIANMAALYFILGGVDDLLPETGFWFLLAMPVAIPLWLYVTNRPETETKP